MTITIPFTDQITVTLQNTGDQANHFWQTMLAGWPPPTLNQATSTSQTFSVSLSQVEEKPQPPNLTTIFRDKRTNATLGLLNVYQPAPQQFTLHFPDGALVEVDLAKQTLRGMYTAEMLHNGRLEDVLFTSLAPLLRRQGCYLVHAFAAVCPASEPPGAVLIVGPTRSGKTTTGLQLVLSGWKLLANDVVLLQHTAERGILAYPWPGLINVRPRTFRLLPKLREQAGVADELLQRDVTLTSAQVASKGWGTAVPAKAIYFPQIETRSESRLIGKNRGIALARLLEESLDRWDIDQIAPHTDVLRRLVNQATPYRLHLGQDMAQLPQLLALQSSAPVHS